MEKTLDLHLQRLGQIHLFQISSFISLCRHLLPIIHEAWRRQRESEQLPLNVIAYLCGHLKLEIEQVDLCWEVLRPIIESDDIQTLQHLIAGPQSTVDSVRRLYSLNVRE